MKYQETGRFGRITKHLRKQGFEKEMEKILFDSANFNNLKKSQKTEYVETVVNRMIENTGTINTEKVLFECGVQCCGKSWSKFVKNIWNNSSSIDDFFSNLNKEESKYNTTIEYNSHDNSITVKRSKCICGLINKGKAFSKYNTYCKCSIGHMSLFFNTIFDVESIVINSSIYNGNNECSWTIKISDKITNTIE